jgi:hypothetical protein
MPPRRRKPRSDDQRPEETPEDRESLRVHEAFLEHRLGGGEPATPDAYLRAVQQFERLPGAVPTGPATGRRIAPPEPEAAPEAEPGTDAEQGDRSGETEGGS